ncbi:hypothetical protein HGA03_10685 [Cellulomonas denverensis]|uniref:Uncharacterized protein n=1 Tax=Cellulomonas denverensis TaxID=264297 RepID=A0A7X6KW54_9CELL|nr:hypothetical protein [Cellulomonas denverensis]NKY23128.1 hypothetical protein [Cellulomonas denverensis]
MIWATRGRSWGFRFLRDGGFPDPLPVYDAVFAAADPGPSALRRADGRAALSQPGVAGALALRFPDPEGRRDRAGRVIPHEFVVFPPLADAIGSVDEGAVLVWPAVAQEYARVWDAPAGPSASAY